MDKTILCKDIKDNYLRNIYHGVGFLTLVLLVSFVYSPVASLSFSGPDDHWMLLKNPYVNPESYDWAYFKAIFKRVNDIQYSPLNTLYYSFVYKINGFDPYYFHVMNVAIHFCSTVSVYFLSKNVLSAFDIDNTELISFFTCLVWCIHPLNVEAVAWISGSKILICTLCTILSFNIFISGYRKKKVHLLLVSFLLFVVSFFFKEQAIITPIMYLIFILFYKLKKNGKISFSIMDILFLFVSFTVSAFFIWHTIHVNYGEAIVFPPIKYYPLTQYFFIVCYCFFFYVSNFFLPRGLHYNYDFPFEPYDITPIEFKLYPFIVLILVLVVVHLYRKSKNKYFNLFCICICLSQLSLELQVLPMTRPAVVADRYMYFPSITLIMASLVFISKYIHTTIFKQIVSPVLLLYVAYLVIYCNQMAGYWEHFNIIVSK